jgi:hypothetical protein
MQPRLALNFGGSCLSLLTAGIIGVLIILNMKLAIIFSFVASSYEVD